MRYTISRRTEQGALIKKTYRRNKMKNLKSKCKRFLSADGTKGYAPVDADGNIYYHAAAETQKECWDNIREMRKTGRFL